jgi:hypothetical protein
MALTHCIGFVVDILKLINVIDTLLREIFVQKHFSVTLKIKESRLINPATPFHPWTKVTGFSGYF